MIETDDIVLDEVLEKFGDECLVMVTGSYNTENFNEYSDIDIIIGSPITGLPYNEKFHSKRLNRKIDALVIPKLNISNEIVHSANTSNGAIIRMMHLGKILKDEFGILSEAKKMSSLYYLKGKEDEDDLMEIKKKCISLSNAIEDLNIITDRLELFFTVSKIIDKLTLLYLKLNKTWSFDGKLQAKNIKEVAPDFSKDISNILSTIFTSNKVHEETISVFKKHLQRFMDYSDSYSTRNVQILEDEISFMLNDITHSDYYVLQSLLSVELRKKFKLYIKKIRFEYIDIKQKALVTINVDTSKGVSPLDVYEKLNLDVFFKIDSTIDKPLKTYGIEGGMEMSKILQDLKFQVSQVLLDHNFDNNTQLEKSGVLKLGFFIHMYALKKYFDPKLELYLLDYWLQNALDIKALKSYNQLAFEKDKLLNYFSIRLSEEEKKLYTYLDHFIASGNTFSEASILKPLIGLLNEAIDKANNSTLYFFDVDSNLLKKYTHKSESDIYSNLAYKTILEAIFNSIGVPFVDRAYFAYVYKSYRNGRSD